MARSTGRTRPVIKDVAKLAGVSAPTVSRYLNGTVNVTEDRRARIAKAIKELGYDPSIVARALSNREMDSVVVFAANPAAFSTSETNHGVEAAARKRRFLLNIVSLDESDMESVEARVRMGLSIRPAGVVVYEYDQAGIAALDYIPKDMPKVVVGLRLPNPLLYPTAIWRRPSRQGMNSAVVARRPRFLPTVTKPRSL